MMILLEKQCVEMDVIEKNQRRFGFKTKPGGTHAARTMMMPELARLLAWIDDPAATKNDYIDAIQTHNCLGKRSGKTRELTARHLTALYGLDPSLTLFRNLLFFWRRDPEGRPLIALSCAYGRDAILRSSRPFIRSHEHGEAVFRGDMEAFIEEWEPGRFSSATLKSTAQNLNATWTQSGHLTGRVKKTRSQAMATPGSAAYALLLGYLSGGRGESLFLSDYASLLDCPVDGRMALAEAASRKGWMVFKRAGNVVEALFPQRLTDTEMEWILEQN
jgi:hypothetical protein